MRVLRRGMRGMDVAEVQKKLGLKVDGLFGPRTEEAIRIFQAKNGLDVDGVVGGKTAYALDLEGGGVLPSEPDPSTLDGIFAKYEEGTVPFYEACYRILEFDKGSDIQVGKAANRLGGPMWSQYEEVERLRGVPAVMIALIHSMECGNDPSGTLHNGERIIGKGLKTTIVPKGRGPFKTWLEGALDAIDLEPIWRVPEWTVGYMLKQCERFNGLGYINGAGRDELSPYIWACTNINDGYGKYTSDGKFDPNAPSNGQVGVAAILKYLETIGVIKLKYSTTI